MENMQKTSRQLQAEKTKLEIFQAAMRLLEKKDFDSITVRDIIQEAHVSVGSFYNAYPSKLDVFYETYHIADEYFEEVVHPQLTQERAEERLMLFFREYALYSSTANIFALTKVIYNPNNTFFLRKKDSGMLSILNELVSYAQTTGLFGTEESPEEMARFFMICIRGVVYDWCISDGSYDLVARVDDYFPKLLRAYKR